MGTLLLCGPPRSATVCFVTLKRSVVRLIAETVTVVMRDSATATRSPREHGSRLRPRRGGDPHLCQLYLHHVAVTWICAWGMMPARQSQENTLTYDLYPAEKQDTFPHLGRAVNYSVQYEQIRSILFHETTRARVKVIREGRAQGRRGREKEENHSPCLHSWASIFTQKATKVQPERLSVAITDNLPSTHHRAAAAKRESHFSESLKQS